MVSFFTDFILRSVNSFTNKLGIGLSSGSFYLYNQNKMKHFNRKQCTDLLMILSIPGIVLQRCRAQWRSVLQL